MKIIKGITQYIGIIMALGMSVIGLVVYALVIQAFRDSQAKSTLAYNIANSGLSLFSGVTGQFSTIGTIAGVLLLAAVVFAFGIGGYALYNKTHGQ